MSTAQNSASVVILLPIDHITIAVNIDGEDGVRRELVYLSLLVLLLETVRVDYVLQLLLLKLQLAKFSHVFQDLLALMITSF